MDGNQGPPVFSGTILIVQHDYLLKSSDTRGVLPDYVTRVPVGLPSISGIAPGTRLGYSLKCDTFLKYYE